MDAQPQCREFYGWVMVHMSDVEKFTIPASQPIKHALAQAGEPNNPADP